MGTKSAFTKSTGRTGAERYPPRHMEAVFSRKQNKDRGSRLAAKRALLSLAAGRALPKASITPDQRTFWKLASVGWLALPPERTPNAEQSNKDACNTAKSPLNNQTR